MDELVAMFEEDAVADGVTLVDPDALLDRAQDFDG